MTEPVRVEPRPVSFEERWWLDHGLEAFKAAVPTLNDALSKLLLVTAAVLGGGLTLLDKGVMPAGFKVGMLALVGLSLAACVAGVTPAGRAVNLLDPNDIRAFEAAAVARKRRCLAWAGRLLVAGFAVGIAGLTWNAVAR